MIYKSLKALLCFIITAMLISIVYVSAYAAEPLIKVIDNSNADYLSYDVSADSKNGIFICGLYDDNKNLIGLTYSKNAEDVQNFKFDMPEKANSGYVLFMLWNSISDMYPLTESKKINWDKSVLSPTLSPTTKPAQTTSSQITLDYNTYPLYVGNSSVNDFSKWDGYGSYFTLTAEVTSEKYSDDDIQWYIDDNTAYFKSTNKNQAVICARRTGIAKVTASLPDGTEDNCYVTVIDNASRLTVQSMTFNTDKLTLSKGDIAELKTIIYPKDVYNLGMLDSSVSWKSSNTDVATVEDGKITAVNIGTATISATSNDVGRVAECIVNVQETDTESNITLDGENTRDMVVGQKMQLNAESDSHIIWKSDNSYIADVDQSGMVTAYSNSNIQNVSDNGLTVTETAGTVTIYATAQNGGKIAEYKIRVKDSDIANEYLIPSDGVIGTSEYIPSIKTTSVTLETNKDIDIDEVYQLQLTADGDSKILWINTNQNIATLDREGNVQGYSTGEINVYAVTEDSLSEEQKEKVKGLQNSRENADEEILDTISNSVYGKCTINVKDSSDYLRNVHIPSETITDNSVNVLWNRSALNHIEDFKEYKVYVNDKETATVTTLGYTVKNLEPSTEYAVKISAVDKSDNEIISETISVQTKQLPIEIINVLDYGAKGNGKVLDTYAIQNAINDCPENGMVYLPEGYTFCSGALFLKSNITFKVDGILLGSTDPKDYPRYVTKWEGWRKTEQSASEWANTTDSLPENHMPHASLINAGKYDEGIWGVSGPYNVENIVICGNGQINANGFILAFNEGPNATYSSIPWTSYEYPVKDPSMRGRAITIQNGYNIYIKDITVAYSPSWTVHTINCDNITFDNMNVISQGNGNTGKGTDIKNCGHIPNGDGIDPESCLNVNIFNTRFSTGDDAVAMKTGRNKEGNELNKPNAYVRITDCISDWSLGGFGTGSENAGGAHDLIFQNITVKNVKIYGIWIKTTEARGGITENVQIKDMSVTGANSAICMNHDYPSASTNPAAEKPILRYVTIENIYSEGTSKGIQATGLKGSYISNISINNYEAKSSVPSNLKYCSNYKIKDTKNTNWSMSNCSDIEIYNTWEYTDTNIKIANARVIKEIDNTNKTITVYNGATGTDLTDGITSFYGKTQKYILSEHENDLLTGDEILSVTSPNGENIAEYSVIVDSQSVDNSYIIAETFSTVSDSWGFKGDGGATVSDGVMNLLTSKKTNDTVAKALNEEITSLSNVNIKFDWKSNAKSGKGNGSWFSLCDSEDNMIFAIYGNGKYVGIGVTTTDTDKGISKIDDFSNDWYRVDLNLDFEKKTINGVITDITNNKVVKTYTDEVMSNSPQNLGKLFAQDGYGDAVISVDNVYIKNNQS